MAIIQFRVSDELKDQATEIYKKLGLDLSSAIRMFLMRSVDVNGIPFSTVIKEEKEPYDGKEAVRILNEIAERSKQLGLDKMTLEEINEEIRLAREERKQKNREILRGD
jgi:DNA-damage-inducible protein J